MKKLFTLFFALICCAPSIWAYDFAVDGIYYSTISSDEVEVVYGQSPYDDGYNMVKYTGDIIIPSSVEHEGHTYSVTSIADMAFYKCDALTSIILPTSVTSIGNLAFYYCYAIASITCPEGLESIGDMAFMGCTALTSLTISSSVNTIGNAAFIYCSNLWSILVDEANTHYDSREHCNALIQTATNTLLQASKLTFIPTTVEHINMCAFADLADITSITIPNSVTTIAYGAFADCSALTSVHLGSGLTSIEEYAFDGCTSLTTLTMASEIPPSIGANAFDAVTTLTCHIPCNSLAAYIATDWAQNEDVVFVDECAIPTTYTRNVQAGSYGTICLPYNSTSFMGARIYELAYITADHSIIYLDEVTVLEAGRPYLFYALNNQIQVLSSTTYRVVPYSHNGLYGTFEEITAVSNFLKDKHIVYDNAVRLCGDNCGLLAYRAYVMLDEVSTTAPPLLPGRRRVGMSLYNDNSATALDNISEDTSFRPASGIYDLLGRKLATPCSPGIYIVDGKKVIIVQ